MKHLFGVLLLCAVLATGCSGLLGKNKGTVGKASTKTAALAAQVDDLDTEKAQLNDKKLTSIGAWSVGVDYSLQKDTNQSPAVSVARTINERIAGLANKPDFKELQEIYKIVDNLVTNQANGEKLLAVKDKEIIKLTGQLKDVQEDREEQVQAALKQSAANAAVADQYKATLSQMDSFWGFGAIGYGLKKLVTKLAWALGITFVIYLILRIGKNFNPIIATIYGIVTGIFSVIVNVIKGIAPGAVQLAGFVDQSAHKVLQQNFADWKGTLVHVVDAIQMCKEKAKVGTTVTIDDILNEAAKSMDDTDKARIEEIKKDLNWK